jgi:hypothetical protein
MRKIPPALVLAAVLTLAVGVSPALAGSAVHQVTSVVPPANRAPTGNDSTDLFVGTGF